MNIWDVLILLVLAGIVVFAVRTMRKNKGSCHGCDGNCQSCQKEHR